MSNLCSRKLYIDSAKHETKELKSYQIYHRPFSYSRKEPGSSDIFIQFYAQGSIEWR